APVWPPAGHVGLAAEAHAAVAAASGLDVDLGSIVHRHSMPEPDPVFLITGASSGIGEATARAAAAHGDRLVLAARNEERLRELATELGGDARARAVHCDVTEWDDVQRAVTMALEAFGRLDVAFANAGFGAKRGFLTESPEHWRSMILTNVYGAALTIRAALPPLRDTLGHLLLTGSVAGRVALPGSVYSATKWAVTALAEAARQELSGSGVRVTLVQPGMVATPFFDDPAGGGPKAGAAGWASRWPGPSARRCACTRRPTSPPTGPWWECGRSPARAGSGPRSRYCPGACSSVGTSTPTAAGCGRGGGAPARS